MLSAIGEEVALDVPVAVRRGKTAAQLDPIPVEQWLQPPKPTPFRQD